MHISFSCRIWFFFFGSFFGVSIDSLLGQEWLNQAQEVQVLCFEERKGKWLMLHSERQKNSIHVSKPRAKQRISSSPAIWRTKWATKDDPWDAEKSGLWCDQRNVCNHASSLSVKVPCRESLTDFLVYILTCSASVESITPLFFHFHKQVRENKSLYSDAFIYIICCVSKFQPSFVMFIVSAILPILVLPHCWYTFKTQGS